MNVIWRTILVHLLARRRVRTGHTLGLYDVGRVRLTTLPTDLDVVGHMNNGRYLSLIDLGRWDLLVRTGIAGAFRDRGWYAVVSAETITFRRSLHAWQRFEVESRILGYDERAVIMEHRCVAGGEVYARAVVRARVVKRRGGTVSHDELFTAVGMPTGQPGVPGWVDAWADATQLPSTRRPAPSVWN